MDDDLTEGRALFGHRIGHRYRIGSRIQLGSRDFELGTILATDGDQTGSAGGACGRGDGGLKAQRDGSIPVEEKTALRNPVIGTGDWSPQTTQVGGTMAPDAWRRKKHFSIPHR